MEFITRGPEDGPLVRAGRYIRQAASYSAFVPFDLPPAPPLRSDSRTDVLLSEANLALGRLDAATEFLPNPDLFVQMYVRKEAVLSSQIEGTQASMVDLLEHEAQALKGERSEGVQEISNYVSALNKGLERLQTLPMSVRLIKEIHAELLRSGRGSKKNPGEFRVSQNWIGGGTIRDASFVPPPPDVVVPAMGQLEKFMHSDIEMPVLIKIALVHAQFETIHPFLDGNGRTGRLMITFFLCWKGVLRRPMLYLSHYLKQHRSRYYDLLQNVRDRGEFEEWIQFFLQGVASVSNEAVETARRIQTLMAAHRKLVTDSFPNSSNGVILLDHLFRRPVINVKQAAEVIARTYPVANQLCADLEKLGLLTEITGQARNRVYRYQPYIELFGENLP